MFLEWSSKVSCSTHLVVSAQPTTPPAGPDITALCPEKCAALHRPPSDCMNSTYILRMGTTRWGEVGGIEHCLHLAKTHAWNGSGSGSGSASLHRSKSVIAHQKAQQRCVTWE